MEELEQSAKQMRMNADLLEGLCQDKLVALFQDKRKARKAYQEEHSKIIAQFNTVSASSIILGVDMGQAEWLLWWSIKLILNAGEVDNR